MCECATSPEGSAGPINDEETLRYFVNSRSNADLKKNRKFGPRSLNRIFSDGLSVCRVDMATPKEVYYTAENLFEIMRKHYDDYGGIVGVLDFKCKIVRQLACEDGGRLICVLETPLDPNSDGGYNRPSHSDIVHAREHCEDQQAIRVMVFNAIVADEGEPYTPLEKVDNGHLKEFLPPALKSMK